MRTIATRDCFNNQFSFGGMWKYWFCLFTSQTWRPCRVWGQNKHLFFSFCPHELWRVTSGSMMIIWSAGKRTFLNPSILSIQLSIYLYISIYIYIYLVINISICLYIHLSIFIYIYLSIFPCISVYLSIFLSLHLYIYSSIYQSILTLHLSIFLSITPSIYLFIFLSDYHSICFIGRGYFDNIYLHI